MNDRMKEAIEKFDEQPVRTRLIITFAGAIVLFMLFELFWYSGNNSETKRMTAEIQQLDQQIADFTQNQQQLNTGIYSQRNSPQQQQLTQLDLQLEKVQSDLEKRTLSLVKPDAMAGLLKDIIKNSAQLKLVSLTKQAPMPLFEPSEQEKQSNLQNQVHMYRHPITLTFEGNYAETQKFIEQLENMQKQVNFESLEYAVEEYPKSTITLVVSTYSMSRKWIGG